MQTYNFFICLFSLKKQGYFISLLYVIFMDGSNRDLD